jgi:hypothetical protein
VGMRSPPRLRSSPAPLRPVRGRSEAPRPVEPRNGSSSRAGHRRHLRAD